MLLHTHTYLLTPIQGADRLIYGYWFYIKMSPSFCPPHNTSSSTSYRLGSDSARPPLIVGNLLKSVALVSTLTLYLLQASAALSTSLNSNLAIYQRPCDTDQCDSLVSKCHLTDRCSCNFKEDAHCARDCIDCLEEKFGKCCSCVGLCPVQANDSHSSHVGDTSDSDHQLFKVLTEEQDIHNRWTTYTEPMSLSVEHPQAGNLEYAYRSTLGLKSAIVSHDEDLRKLDCTVAFINKQLSMSKCKRSCTSMGAVHFRWFHEGCCECIGLYCLRYGIDHPRCMID